MSEWNGFTPDGAATTGDLSFPLGSSSVNAEGTLNVTGASGLTNLPTIDLSFTGLSLYTRLTFSPEVKEATANTNLFGLASSRNEHLFAAGTNGSSNGLFLFDGCFSKGGTAGNSSVSGVASPTSSIITITAGGWKQCGVQDV